MSYHSCMHVRHVFFFLKNIQMLIIINTFVGCYDSHPIKSFWGVQNAIILKTNDKLTLCLILENQINYLWLDVWQISLC